MKVKHFFEMLLIICLLSCSDAATMKRRKIKKLEPITVLIGALTLMSYAIGQKDDQVKNDSKKKMVKMYSEYLSKLEGVKRFFLDSMLSICTYAMNAATLNLSMLFQFKFRLEKLKHNLPSAEPKAPTYEDKDVEALILMAQIKLKEKNKIHKCKATKKLEMELSAEIKYRFNKMKEEIQKIVDYDVQMKNSLCFGKTNEVDKLGKSQAEAFEKLNETAQKLEDTSILVALFRDDEKSKEYREIWLTNLEKYAPDEKVLVENKIESSPSQKRTFKGLLHILSLIAPIFRGNAQPLLSSLNRFYYSRSTDKELFKQALKKIGIEFAKFVAEMVGQKVLISLFGDAGRTVLPILKTLKAVRSIINSKKELQGLETKLNQEIIQQQINSENALKIKSMQVSSMGHNSILSYRMLKKLTNSDLKMDVKVKGGLEKNQKIKELCKENYYLCQAEMGKTNILDIFPGVKVCSKEIFISKNGADSILTKNRFVPSKKIKHQLAEFYEDLFFSTSGTSIVDIMQNPKVKEKDEIIKAFLSKIKNNFAYKAEKCKFEANSISIQELNLSNNKIILIRAKDDLIKECEALGVDHCYKLEDILHQKSTHSMRKVKDDTYSSKSIPKQTSALETIKDDQKELEMNLLGSVCDLIEQPLKVFPEKEKDTITKKILDHLNIPTEAALRDENTEFSYYLGNFLKPMSFEDLSSNISILDAMLVFYNKVINEKTIVLSFKKNNRPFVKFRMKDYTEDNQAEFPSYISRGNKKCIDIQMIKNGENGRITYKSSIDVLKLYKKGWFSETKPGIDKDSSTRGIVDENGKNFEDTVNEDEIDYLASFFSRFDYERTSFKIETKSTPFDFFIGSIVNDKMFESVDYHIGLKQGFEDFLDCKYNFQIVKVEMTGPVHAEGYHFAIERDEVRLLPKIKISQAKESELAFKSHFYVLLHFSSQNLNEHEIISNKNILMSIQRKLAKFNYFRQDETTGNSNQAGCKVKLVKKNLKSILHHGEISIEVFVSPMEHKDLKENNTVCDNIQKNKK